MKSLRVLVAEDEAPARRKLVRMLAALGGVDLVGEAPDGFAALHALASLRPDLALLDIDMPGLNGLEVARATPKPTQIVFVTAHAEHALQAFELHACDYLLKPYDQARLNDVIAHARERVAATPQRLEVDLGNRRVFIPLDALDWAQAARNYVEIHTEGKTLLTRTTLDAFAARLSAETFFRINRSVLVRQSAIAETRTRGHGEACIRLVDGSEHVWTRRYRPRSSQA